MLRIVITDHDDTARDTADVTFKIVDDPDLTATARNWKVEMQYSVDGGVSWITGRMVNGTGILSSSFSSSTATEHTASLDTSDIPAADLLVRLVLNSLVDQTDEIEVGDGFSTDFEANIPNVPVVAGTAQVTTTLVALGGCTLDDDGNGNLVEISTATGSSGTINYQTGRVEISYGAAVVSGTAVDTTYKTYTSAITISLVVGTGDGAKKVFYNEYNYAVNRNTLKVTTTYVSGATSRAQDNGDGLVVPLAGVSRRFKEGNVDYRNGTIRLVYYDAPSSGAPVNMEAEITVASQTQSTINVDNVTAEARMVKMMPAFMVYQDPDKVLNFFYKIIELERRKRTGLITSLAEIFDPYRCPSGLLNTLGESIGLNMDENYPEEVKRRHIAGAMNWYKEKGRSNAFETFFNQRGWTVDVQELWSNGYTCADSQLTPDFYKIPRLHVTLLKYSDDSPIGVENINRLYNLLWEVLPIHDRLHAMVDTGDDSSVGLITGYDFWDRVFDIADQWDTYEPAIASHKFDYADIRWRAPGAFSSSPSKSLFYGSFPPVIRDGTAFMVRERQDTLEKIGEGDGATILFSNPPLICSHVATDPTENKIEPGTVRVSTYWEDTSVAPSIFVPIGLTDTPVGANTGEFQMIVGLSTQVVGHINYRTGTWDLDFTYSGTPANNYDIMVRYKEVAFEHNLLNINPFSDTEYARNFRLPDGYKPEDLTSLIGSSGVQYDALIDSGGAATNPVTGKVGIPSTGHSIPVGTSVAIYGTTNYDGVYTVDSSTTANVLVISAGPPFVAETFPVSPNQAMITKVGGWNEADSVSVS